MLTSFWKNNFGDFPPIAHELKLSFKDRWVRFHALPDSKRYPETESEYQEVFSRHNQILEDLCISSNEVYIVGVEHSEKKEPQNLADNLKHLMTQAVYWVSIPMHDPEDEEENHFYWHLHVKATNWESGAFDKIFRLVADGEIGNFMIVSTNLGWVFHPYDGGVDIILRDRQEVQNLKKKYLEWQSPLPSGL